jgi:hypothetical protein
MQVRRGQLVSVLFSDHAEDSSKAIRFVVYGRVAEITRKTISIDCWEYEDTKQSYDDNVKRYTIVRAAVHKITQLGPR